LLVPLSCAALLAGILALVRAFRSGRSRLTFPSAGVAVSGAVAITALGCPGLLGPVYQSLKEQGATDPTVIRRIPLPGRAATTGAEDPEWADASRTALQQGQVNVQVEEVAVAPMRSAPVPNKESKRDLCLVIRLRIRQQPQTVMSSTNRRGDAAALKQRYPPTVADTTGKVYELLEVQVGDAAEKTRGVSAFGMSSRVLVFEAPPAGVRALRLEVPAAAWGGRGAFRFRIPGPMIRRDAGL
jgi:hypothetical protein